MYAIAMLSVVKAHQSRAVQANQFFSHNQSTCTDELTARCQSVLSSTIIRRHSDSHPVLEVALLNCERLTNFHFEMTHSKSDPGEFDGEYCARSHLHRKFPVLHQSPAPAQIV